MILDDKDDIINFSICTISPFIDLEKYEKILDIVWKTDIDFEIYFSLYIRTLNFEISFEKICEKYYTCDSWFKSKSILYFKMWWTMFIMHVY